MNYLKYAPLTTDSKFFSVKFRWLLKEIYPLIEEKLQTAQKIVFRKVYKYFQIGKYTPLARRTYNFHLPYNDRFTSKMVFKTSSQTYNLNIQDVIKKTPSFEQKHIATIQTLATLKPFYRISFEKNIHDVSSVFEILKWPLSLVISTIARYL